MFYQFWLKLSKRFSKKPLAHATGERSEAFAAKHLKEKGYKVVVRSGKIPWFLWKCVGAKQMQL
jgi:rhodanese-related sulfurtransferase